VSYYASCEFINFSRTVDRHQKLVISQVASGELSHLGYFGPNLRIIGLIIYMDTFKLSNELQEVIHLPIAMPCMIWCS
jgi:hypothetical protein